MTPSYPPMAFDLRTERLTLRLRDARDVELNLQLHAERLDDAGPGRPWVPWEREQVAQRLTDQRATAHAQGFGLLALDRRDPGDGSGGDTIGYCGLIVGRVGAHEPELAYELLQSAHGHGYATEAARAVVDAAFATGRTRLWSAVRPWNAASFGVLAKVGFVRDHEFDDEWGTLVMNRLDASG